MDAETILTWLTVVSCGLGSILLLMCVTGMIASIIVLIILIKMK